MKIDIRDFFENYQDTEIEIQPDQEFDGEKLIRMTRRELRRKKVRRVTTVLAAAAALVAVVFAAGIGMTRETATYEFDSREGTRFASGNEGEEKTFSSWIGEMFGVMKTKKISYGEQGKEPGMRDWSPNMEGMLLEFDEEKESEIPKDIETETENEAESETEVIIEDDEKKPAYLEGPAVGEKLLLTGFQFGYLPQSGRKAHYESKVDLKSKLEYKGYSGEEISKAFTEEELAEAYTYVTKEGGPCLDYMIQMIQPFEAETRTFSFRGDVTIVKTEKLGEWEGTWLTVDVYEVGDEKASEEVIEEVPEEVIKEIKQVDHHLLLYHPEKHYLINLSVDANVHEMEELDKMAADITVVEAEMEATRGIHEDINFPDMTFCLNAARG